MPAERVAMRVVREVLRLTFAGVSKREVSRRTGMAASTVRATIARFELLGLVWPLRWEANRPSCSRVNQSTFAPECDPLYRG